EVHTEVQLPVLDARVLELPHRIDDPGVVDADVHGAQIALDGRDHRSHLRGVAHVALVAASAAERLRRLLGALAIEVEDRHAASFPGQHLGVGAAEAARTSGYQSDLVADSEVHDRSAALELRLALAEERLNPLAGVLRAQRLDEGPRLHLERMIDRRLETI